ncbi:ribokinase [Gordonia sp. CPCC 206044]|uniref:ribokinase n=1 Tax=Gordonia sp. CPCC 206044 TaxID=3140793 RepID=UPI003AF34195
MDTPDSAVAVVGTLNMDLIVRVDRMPDVGQTVLGTSLRHRPGGKGANQALAAAMIAPTAMIGAVGDDDAGARLVATQRSADVDVTHLKRVDTISGQAIIEVDAVGDNRIVVLSGANAALTAEDVRRGLDDVDPIVVLTQLESPAAVTRATAQWAIANDRRFVLNPSPVAELDEHILAVADPLVVNDGEASFYAGDDTDDPTDLARGLLGVARSAVVTLGGHGVVVAADPDDIRHIAVEDVDAVDTTGAGDVFAGTLAAHLARGTALPEACEIAARAATDHVARPR